MIIVGDNSWYERFRKNTFFFFSLSEAGWLGEMCVGWGANYVTVSDSSIGYGTIL